MSGKPRSRPLRKLISSDLIQLSFGRLRAGCLQCVGMRVERRSRAKHSHNYTQGFRPVHLLWKQMLECRKFGRLLATQPRCRGRHRDCGIGWSLHSRGSSLLFHAPSTPKIKIQSNSARARRIRALRPSTKPRPFQLSTHRSVSSTTKILVSRRGLWRCQREL